MSRNLDKPACPCCTLLLKDKELRIKAHRKTKQVLQDLLSWFLNGNDWEHTPDCNAPLSSCNCSWTALSIAVHEEVYNDSDEIAKTPPHWSGGVYFGRIIGPGHFKLLVKVYCSACGKTTEPMDPWIKCCETHWLHAMVPIVEIVDESDRQKGKRPQVELRYEEGLSPEVAKCPNCKGEL